MGKAVGIIGIGVADWYEFHRQRGEMGWEIPVLEGYSCAIALARLFVDLGVDASGLQFPGERPKRWRRKKTF